MSEPDLNSLPLFIAVVEAGSFTAAAERLGCTKTKVSLVIKTLEKNLGLALFTRTTRQVSLTEAGQQLYQRCQPLLVKLQETLGEVGTDAQMLSGTLRITAPADHMALSLAPAAAAFSRLHPDLSLELRSGDQVADMVREGIDLAIRMGWLKDSSLRAQKLGEFEQVLLASRDYLVEMGEPKHPSELSRHRWLEFNPLPSSLNWTFEKDGEALQVQMHSRIKVDSTGTLRSLLLAGAGISVMARFGAYRENELIQILTNWRLPKGGVYAVFPPGTFVPAKARAFMNFYKNWLAE